MAHGLPSTGKPAWHREPLFNPNSMLDATPQLRVLVIDDSADNAEALSALLEVMGCATAVAHSGRDGIALFTEFDPHLAFVDLEMPEMGGCEVVVHLVAKRGEGSARFFCLTGRGHPDDRRTCMEAGFDDFFTKPITYDRLAEIVAVSSAALKDRLRT